MQARRRTSEMQFLSDRDEVTEVTEFHGVMIPQGYCSHTIYVLDAAHGLT